MDMTRRAALAAGASVAVAGAAAAPASAQTRWQIACAYPDNNYFTRTLRQMATDIEAATNGRLAFQLHTNGSLLPMPQIKRGVQQGQVQIGEILLSAYGNEDPFFELDGIPQLARSFDDAKRLMTLTRPFIEERFNRQGLSLLYLAPWPPSGFYTNTPLTSLEGLRGSRLRTYNAMTNRFATLIGAVPTLVQAAEVPQAFATGVVNAMVTSATTGVDSSAWDYARIFTPIGFTYTKNAIFVNRRAFQALSAADQAAVRTAAAAAETRGWAAAADAQTSQEAILGQRGMTVAQPTPAMLAEMDRVSATMVTEWLAKAGEEGTRVINAYRART
ncbi:TRAP transporter substrate-binding protein DctP [Rhodovarius crocodyli]|uniref:TRAP transporter substrate-binding protein DctP n=1 Tax=Rhodovarius crocodyli TaxID=1979269 RepID=A0A437MP36_9PROT|nr:TRAP transporter substrate-binding protein [Rhodovarius crocodyli]RVT99380.1 TRAP transporter substrate-binding protein DctP [Rhodovarius crocodyli]